MVSDKQRRRELMLMVHACMDAHGTIEGSRDEEEWEYERVFFETLRDALPDDYVHDKQLLDRELKLSHDDRCYIMDNLESLAIDFDELLDDPNFNPGHPRKSTSD